MPQNSSGPRPDAWIAAAVTMLLVRPHSEKINSIIRVESGVIKAAATGAKGPAAPPRITAQAAPREAEPISRGLGLSCDSLIS